MIDKELVDDLKKIIKSCKYKSKNLINNDSITVKYLITVKVLQCLTYCLERDKINTFETLLDFSVYQSSDDLDYIEEII